MNQKQIHYLMYGLLITGIVLALSGIGLVAFTDMTSSQGISGIIKIVALIGTGLLLAAPSKLYLTYHVMRLNDEKQAQRRQQENSDRRD